MRELLEKGRIALSGLVLPNKRQPVIQRSVQLSSLQP